MPKGKHDFVVWEWRALLPVLISARGCDIHAKQHTKRQCSATVLDPSLCRHQESPSPLGPPSFSSYALKLAKTEKGCSPEAQLP